MTLLATRTAAGEKVLLAHADAAGLALDAVLTDAWQDLRGVLETTHGWHADYQRALRVLAPLAKRTTDTLTARLRGLYHAGHTLTVQAVVGSLTVGALERLVATGRRRLAEDNPPGLLTLAGDPVAGTFHGPSRPQTRDEWASWVHGLIFPPPPEETIWRALAPLVQPAEWEPLGDDQRKLPHDLARTLADGLAMGKSQRDVARDLLPYLEGSRVRARRVARTFGLHVAHSAQMEAYAGLGDHVIGYTLHARKDEHSRPWHKARDGQVYHVDPRPGQKGLAQMPRPPLEPEDPAERPAKAPALAWHCRCNLSVVLRGLEQRETPGPVTTPTAVAVSVPEVPPLAPVGRAAPIRSPAELPALKVNHAGQVLAAFHTLDAAAPRWAKNFISLVDLRKALPSLTPEQFTAGLYELRRERKLSLSAAEGRHGISAAERAAGIHEEGQLLLHVSAPGG